MKHTLRTCLMIALLGVAVGCALPFSTMQEPEIHVINIEPLEAEGLFEQRARVELRIINPNDVDLSMTGFSFKMDINDAPFTRGVSNKSLTVPRLGEAKTSVVVTTSVLDVFRQVAALHGREHSTYRIEGTIYLGNARVHSVSFKHAGKMGERR